MSCVPWASRPRLGPSGRGLRLLSLLTQFLSLDSAAALGPGQRGGGRSVTICQTTEWPEATGCVDGAGNQGTRDRPCLSPRSWLAPWETQPQSSHFPIPSLWSPPLLPASCQETQPPGINH